MPARTGSRALSDGFRRVTSTRNLSLSLQSAAQTLRLARKPKRAPEKETTEEKEEAPKRRVTFQEETEYMPAKPTVTILDEGDPVGKEHDVVPDVTASELDCDRNWGDDGDEADDIVPAETFFLSRGSDLHRSRDAVDADLADLRRLIDDDCDSGSDVEDGGPAKEASKTSLDDLLADIRADLDF